MREDRKNNELRKIKITKDYIDYPIGAVLIEMGQTRVLCTASLEEGVPKFLLGTEKGWLTAEYNMLPGATITRKKRDIKSLKMDGRSTEIQRLIGRSLRSIIDLNKIPELSIVIDCDVLQADGGTRCASINGAYLALKLGVEKLLKEGKIKENPLIDKIGAVSVGIVDNEPILDLQYSEDSRAQVDMNVVMTGSGEFIELQGTGEGRSFTKGELDTLLDLAKSGIEGIIKTYGE